MRYTSPQHIKEGIMERFTRQSSTPNTNATAPSAAPASTTKQTAGVMEPSLSSKIMVLSIIVAAALVTLAMAVGLFRSFKTTSLVNADRYQAVFLDNGQVYFGKLSNVNASYAKLNDIFYLQVEQQIQPDQQKAGETAEQQQPQISLAKLGNELHGPEDEMFILQSKIVFWENLKSEGQVVTAITNFKNGGGNTNNSGDNGAAGIEQTGN